jgi:hypothetical protein
LEPPTTAAVDNSAMINVKTEGTSWEELERRGGSRKSDLSKKILGLWQ